MSGGETAGVMVVGLLLLALLALARGFHGWSFWTHTVRPWLDREKRSPGEDQEK